MSSDIPKVFNQYEISELIGTGGMARVYRARQLNIDRDVALKVMSTALSDQEEFQVRFKREADVFARLEHPHILPIYDYGKYEMYLFLVLRLMEGGTLEKLMRGQQLPLADLDRLVAQVAQALDYAHENDIVHRDLKPNNILLDKFGNAYLMDFGIAKVVSEAQSANMSTMLGTPAYMAPEQWRLDEIDGRVDTYSLAVMTYEMLTGQMPFNGATPYHLMYAHLHDEPVAPSEFISGLTADIDAAVLRGLAKDPRERYQRATHFAKDLSAAIRKQTQDSRGQLATLASRLQGEDKTVQIEMDARKSDALGSILLALDRPNGRVYAIPKVEDFKEAISAPKTDVTKRFESWKVADFLQELKSTSTSNYNTVGLKAMLEGGAVKQTQLGVGCQPVKIPPSLQGKTGQEYGMLVFDVKSGGLGERVGLMLGDTLLSINNQAMRSQDDLNSSLSGRDSVVIRVMRAGQIEEITARLD